MEYVDNIEIETDNWVDKHKPQTRSNIVGNSLALSNIITWLMTFNKNKKEVLKSLAEVAQESKKKTKTKKKPLKKASDDENTLDDDIDEPVIDIPDEVVIENTENTTFVKPKKKKGPYSCMLITGNHGIGKTCAVQAILKDLKYDVQIINFSRIKSSKNIKDILDKLVNNKTNIMAALNETAPEKTVIVVDELESLTSRAEINCIAAIMLNNEKNWNYPIIFIANTKHNKFISEIKKKSYEVNMWPPDMNDLRTLFNRITKDENMKITNIAVINKILEQSQRDLRRLVYILQDIKSVYEEYVTNNKLTDAMITEYFSKSKKKDLDYDLYRAAGNVLFNYIGIDNTLRLYETDKVNLPLMVHQNYLHGINNYCPSVEGKHILSRSISESLSKGDVIENYIYGNQNWTIHEAHGFYSCICPSYLLDNCRSDRNFKLGFPDDLNRTSIKCINKKNILKVNEYLKNMNIHDYIYINQIIRNLLEDGRIEECVALFDQHDFKFDNIDKILKVDKIKSSKINLTGKQKKDITKIIKMNSET